MAVKMYSEGASSSIARTMPSLVLHCLLCTVRTHTLGPEQSHL